MANRASADLAAIVRAKNYQTNAWETLGVTGVMQLDSMFTHHISVNPTRFMKSGTRELEVLVEWVPLQDVMSEDGWLMSVDCVRWNIQH